MANEHKCTAHTFHSHVQATQLCEADTCMCDIL